MYDVRIVQNRKKNLTEYTWLGALMAYFELKNWFREKLFRAIE